MSHARCTTCDRRLLEHDCQAMLAINDQQSLWSGPLAYDLKTEDGTTDLYCADCLAGQAEAAQERRDADYYGGSGPVTLEETMAAARRLK